MQLLSAREPGRSPLLGRRGWLSRGFLYMYSRYVLFDCGFFLALKLAEQIACHVCRLEATSSTDEKGACTDDHG